MNGGKIILIIIEQLLYVFQGHFNFVEVLVEPLASGVSRVSVRAKRGMEQMMDSRSFVISDQWLPVLVRQKALQANVSQDKI